MANLLEVRVPDLGDYKDIPVIDVLVKAGDNIAVDTSLLTLESDKAAMEVPSPAAGVVKELKVKTGDKLSKGSLILLLEVADGKAAPAGEGSPKPATEAKPAAAEAKPVAPEAKPVAPEAKPAAKSEPKSATHPEAAAWEEQSAPADPASAAAPAAVIDEAAFMKAHAGPGVRAFARELGVDLSKVTGTGPKQRILREDLSAWVKARLTAPAPAVAGGAGLDLIPWPKVDYAKYGPIESKPLSRIKKIAGKSLHRNWVQIPHVTSCEDADITQLEEFRVQVNQESQQSGVKVTLLAFLIKAVVAALQKFPEFNSSLEGENLILKRYWHIGFAADTPNGLLVPVIRDADRKGLLALAMEAAELAGKARDGKLQPAEMQGATFSISSLGGIGGTYFTPIINAPEVAILGVCRAAKKPVWDGEKFAPRLVLPLSLSWDHRVVDGAAAGRFNSFLAAALADARRLLL
jgi:pyruvate dehydrogenase E2 component (dihydrolipoamide acetyltransferase)